MPESGNKSVYFSFVLKACCLNKISRYKACCPRRNGCGLFKWIHCINVSYPTSCRSCKVYRADGIASNDLQTSTTAKPQSSSEKLEQLVLTYPGSHISATKMNNLSKFRRDGGKQKVLMIFNSLENKRLGSISHGKNNVSDRIKCI